MTPTPDNEVTKRIDNSDINDLLDELISDTRATPPSETPKGEDATLDKLIAAIEAGDHVQWWGDEFLMVLERLKELRTLRKGRGRVIRERWAAKGADGELIVWQESRDLAVAFVERANQPDSTWAAKPYTVAKVITVEVEDE